MYQPNIFVILISSAAIFCTSLKLAAEQAGHLASWANNMSNQELAAAALAQRNDKHCPTQKALNQQWLNQHNGDNKAKVGNKALQFIAKKMLHNYWGDRKTVQFGHSNNAAKKASSQKFSTNKLDYGLKLSANKLKLAVNYPF